MNKKFRKIILPLSLLASSQAYSLGLGNMQVYTALDEELSGTIPLVVDENDDIENIKVTLASSEDYDRVGLDKSYVPSNIKVKISENQGTKFIELGSNGPISEPIVSLLLVVDWSNGHLLREYTLLLDPPMFSSTQNSSPDPVQTKTYEAPSQITSTISDGESENSPQTSSNAVTNNSSSTPMSTTNSNQVVVESGDTLWQIANRFSDGFNGPQQMMVAIYNKNLSAFTNSDMNLLNKGAVLDIPASADASMISNGEAIDEVKSHLQNWSRSQTSNNSDVRSNTSNTDYGIELVPPLNSDDSSSSNTSGSSNSVEVAATRAQLIQTREQLASSEIENDELSSRVKELEKIVQDQEMALSLKDTNLAQLQEQLSDSNNEAIADEDTTDAALLTDNATNDDVWDESVSTDTDETDSLNIDEQDSDIANNDDLITDDSDSNPIDDVVGTESDENDLDNQLTSTDSDSQDVEDADVAVDKQTEDQTSIQTPVPTKERSFMDKMMDYKTEGMIGLGVLILSIIGFVFYRRKSTDVGDVSEEGGFLDSISNNKNSEDEDDLSNTNDTEEDLNLDSSELDLKGNDFDIDESNVSDIDDLDIVDEADVDELDEAPAVVVMDDQSDESDVDLDIDFDQIDLDETQSESDDLLEDVSDVLDIENTELDENDSDLDFDLDNIELNELDDESENNDESDEGDTSDLLDEDFNLELDLDLDDDLDSDLSDNQDELLDPISIDTEENDIVNDNDVDEKTSEVDSMENSEDLEFDLDDDIFDSDDLDLDGLELDEFDIDEESSQELEDVMLNVGDETSNNEDEFNSDFNINLDEDSSDDNIEPEELEFNLDDDSEVDIGLDFDDIQNDDAIDTKIDLAKAYFEMGDIDGAKQMVTEIIEEGSESQIKKAKELELDINKS